MLLKAPAKINLTLKILSKREDGYHEISSMMRAIRLFDEVDMMFVDSEGIRLHCEGVPDGPENLAYRAAELALKTWGLAKIKKGRTAGIDITLKKRIPVAAGMAGGSADAAAVLLGLAKGLQPEAGIADVAALGVRIGADVPFCVYSCAEANRYLGYNGAGTMVAEGIGEKLHPVCEMGQIDVLLIKPPNIEINSGALYALYDADKSLRPKPSDCPVSDNDLEAYCTEVHPIVGGMIMDMKKICKEEGAGDVKVQVSGSGPGIFIYFADYKNGTGHKTGKTAIQSVYERASKAFPDSFLFLTTTL